MSNDLTNSPFMRETNGNCQKDLASTVSIRHQTRFVNKLRRDLKKMDGNLEECMYLGWKNFKAARSLLFSSIMYVECEELQRNDHYDALISYGLYYSFFHATYALICLNPNIDKSKLRKIKHHKLFRMTESIYVSTKILPQEYIKHFEKLRILRELTSYFVPLGGLKKSTLGDINNVNKIIDDTKNYLKYAFQLAYIIDCIIWDIKSTCMIQNKAECKSAVSKSNDMYERLDELIFYPDFNYAKYELSAISGSFDEADSIASVRKFGLYDLCPITPIYDMVTDHLMEEISDTISSARESKIYEFFDEVW